MLDAVLEVLVVVFEVLEVVGVNNSATFLTALAIVLNALFVFDVEAAVEEVREDLSESDWAAASLKFFGVVVAVVVAVVVMTADVLLSPNFVVVGTARVWVFLFDETTADVFVDVLVDVEPLESTEVETALVPVWSELVVAWLSNQLLDTYTIWVLARVVKTSPARKRNFMDVWIKYMDMNMENMNSIIELYLLVGIIKKEWLLKYDWLMTNVWVKNETWIK